MIELSIDGPTISIRPASGDFKPRHENQLAYWGFARTPDGMSFVARDSHPSALLTKLVAYFERDGVPYDIDDAIQPILEEEAQSKFTLRTALDRCTTLKDGHPDQATADDFAEFLRTSIARPLKPHQFKAALHLLAAENGANFSVPGSGKTTVVLAVFQKLRLLGCVDSLFVVGPPACFAPWKEEYRQVLGAPPGSEVLAGGDIENRRTRYLVDNDSVRDLYLTTFQTLQHDWEHVGALFLRSGIRFFLVIDEAHYIKQLGGAWATAVLNIAQHATRRCVLTGTPFPRSYTDAFNLFDVLWPNRSAIADQQRHRISYHLQRGEIGTAGDLLQQSIGPLFYRVRKDDLGLAPQVFHDPIQVPMNPIERLLYDSVMDRIVFESQRDYFRDFDLLVKLRKGRMMRLRQCVSYAGLLASVVADYSEDLLADELSLASTLRRYDALETPGKLQALVQLLARLCRSGQKVVIWSTFIRSLKLITERLSQSGYRVGLIYGATPFEVDNAQEELSRETIIHDFTERPGRIDVLVANPAACAESVSLHKACHQAVYYDLSYNGAQYLQSLDRIHRVGGSEHHPAHYYVLQYENTIDRDILTNVRDKADRMNAVVDQEYAIYGLDMFTDDEELEAYDRLFPKERQ